MGNLRLSDNCKLYSILMSITMLFIVVQPIFDLLSFLYIREFIPFGISSYAKPLIIGLLNIALVIVYKKQIIKCVVLYGLYLIFMIVHSLLLKDLLVENSVIFHEIRFMINLLYMLICYRTIKILNDEAPDSSKFSKYLKKTLVATFGLYIALFFVSVLSGTSAKTYEYADPLKQGYKGWLDSGQIFGHAFCICLPVIISFLLNNNANKKWIKIALKFSVVIPILTLCLVGTKVSYFMPLAILGVQIILEIFFAIKDKNKSHIFNGLICSFLIVACILAYPITPVRQNIDINNGVLSDTPDGEDITHIIEQEKDKYNIDNNHNNTDKIESQNPNNSEIADNSVSIYPKRYLKNLVWTKSALKVLEEKYVNGQLHPADMRSKQLYFNFEKFKISDIEFKIFGIGYLNQQDMAIERDILCIFFSFGLLGFVLILLRPICLWIKSGYIILRKLLKTDIQTFCLFEGFSIFFFISWFAGYTLIYTNFSIFLAVIMVLLHSQVKEISNAEK